MALTINGVAGKINEARQCPSPNHDDRTDENDINLIVIHNITLPPGQFGGEAIDQLFTNQLSPDDHPFFAEIHTLRVSSHLLIRRDGELVQYVPLHKRAFHAGVSCFQGREACNDYSIGIELEGTDDCAYTDEQYKQLEVTIKALLGRYSNLSIDRITGHEHIAPGRKTDPGPYFDWTRLGAALNTLLPAKAS